MRGSKQRSWFTPSFHRVNLHSLLVPRELYGVILAAIIARNPRLIAITVSGPDWQEVTDRFPRFCEPSDDTDRATFRKLIFESKYRVSRYKIKEKKYSVNNIGERKIRGRYLSLFFSIKIL